MDPIEQLIEEHKNILRGVNLLERTSNILMLGGSVNEEIELLIQFFAGYADQGHHAKEEKILFERLYAKDEWLKKDTSPLEVLRVQHIESRSLVKNLRKIDARFDGYVLDYADLLRRHINIENEIFPTLAEDYFDRSELMTMGLEFSKEDAELELDYFLAILDKVDVRL
ncbi:MAG: hypothetical protein GPJ54_04010 [Candidatus Heimdallarchaeota archaeon]|nr:hypothetical protein [Candidatus Heimdallarchaeota archaeon]